MRRVPSAHALVLLLAAACAGGESTGPGSDAGAPPPVSGAARWSDPRSWPNGQVPAAGADVTIPADRAILLDVSPPPLNSLDIRGTLAIRDTALTLTSGWIMVHGRLEAGTAARPLTSRVRLVLTTSSDNADVMGMGNRVLGVMGGGRLDIHGEPRLAWTRLNATAPAGATEITLERSTDWRVGDVLVIASTDFEPNQAEEVTVTAVSGARVSFTPALRFQHYGQRQTFGGRTLDERAEVALLTRNVTIMGDSASAVATGRGGHVMVMQGGTANISGTQFFLMGQRGQQARYPFHWHMAGDVTGQVFRGNSIWRSFNRCVTVHGTDNAVVEANVCHDHIGHGYFLEDGSESGNRLLENLGLTTKIPAAGEALLPSDSRPATFWVTHPANELRQNVAAGSRGFGFWYAFPAAPTGPSTGQPDLPRRTPLGIFDGNVAHSNRSAGLNVDDGPRPDLTTEVVSYQPRENPAANSAPVVAVFRNFTGYKHVGRAVWLRGHEHRLVGAMLADNAIGATFASSESIIQDAVVVGTSDNTAGTTLGSGTLVRGFEFYDGRVGAERVQFFNFTGTPTAPAGALAYNRRNSFPVNPRNFAAGMTFTNANRVYLENPLPDRDGDRQAVFLDTDGSVTGTANRWVVANHPFLLGAGCERRDAWNAHVCEGRYLGMRIVHEGTDPRMHPVTITRQDGVAQTQVGATATSRDVALTLLPGRGYRLAFGGPQPAQLRLTLQAGEPGDWVRLTVPWTAASFSAWRDFNTGSPLQVVASAADVDAGTGERVHHDAANALLHLKLQVRSAQTSATVHVQAR